MKKLYSIVMIILFTSCMPCKSNECIYDNGQPINILWKGEVIEGKVINILCSGDVYVEFYNKYDVYHKRSFTEKELKEVN